MSGNLVNQSRLADDMPAGSTAEKRQVDRRFVEAIERSRISGADAMGAALAHELNQPLAALTIYLQSVQRQFEKASNVVGSVTLDMLNKAVREAERASEIVRRMRRFSTPSEPERLPIDLNTLAEESIELSTIGLTPAPHIMRDYHSELPVISGDPVQVRQIMVNLLRNAVDAVSAHSKPLISIVTRNKGDFVHFSISDNGSGIDPRIAAKLFKAFETSKPNGMGLGLAISRMIAQNHGGDLFLNPGGDNSGACFDLRLPITALNSSETIKATV